MTAYPLISRLEAYEYWKRCAYISVRRLQDGHDKDVFNMNIDHFLDQVIGKPYLFKVSDIFFAKYSKSSLSTIRSVSTSILPNLFTSISKNTKVESSNGFNRTSDISKVTRISSKVTRISESNIDTDEISSTYFCSQLVADCLKQLDIIDDSLNSKSFWPGSFSENDLIDKITINGYSYGVETIVNFTTLEVGNAKVMNNASNVNKSTYYSQEERPRRIDDNRPAKIEATFKLGF